MVKTQNYYSHTLMHQIKTEDGYENFSNDKEMLDFSTFLTRSKYYDN